MSAAIIVAGATVMALALLTMLMARLCTRTEPAMRALIRPTLRAFMAVALCASAAFAQTQITDAAVDERLARAEAAFRQGKSDEALQLLREVTGWADHIGDMRIRRGSRDPAADAAFAERMYQRALATIGRTFGPNHISAYKALRGLALLYTEEKRYGEAAQFLRRALDALTRAQALAEEKRFEEGTLMLDLARTYERHGRDADAETAYRRAADLFGQAGPRAVEARDGALVDVARLLRRAGRTAAADQLEARMLPQHRLASRRMALQEAWEAAGAAQRAGRIADAQRILEDAAREAELLGAQEARGTRLLLLRFYLETGRAAELKELCQKLGLSDPPC